MPKYIKKEIVDLNGKGTSQAYYRMQAWRRLESEEFVERVHSYNGAFSKSTIIGVMSAVRDQIVRELANGYTVTIDGVGTFGCRLGVRPDKEMDGFEDGETKRNARSIMVTGVTFRADKEMARDIDSRCDLERGGVERLQPSKYSQEERIQRAKQYLQKRGYMHVDDYAALTGLSYSTASRELRRLASDPESGITSRGRKSAKLYVLQDNQ